MKTEFHSDEQLNAGFEIEDGELFEISFSEGSSISSGTYEGDYTVIPKWAEQILPTKDKVMTADVDVKPIPRYDVSNPSGGVTVTIGGVE